MYSLSQNKIPIRIKRNPIASELRLSTQIGGISERKVRKYIDGGKTNMID
jgi:hypothetical protein